MADGFLPAAWDASTVPSTTWYAEYSVRACWNVSPSPGARAASTSVTSSGYRYAIVCDVPNSAPSARPAAQNKPDQLLGDVEHDTMGDQVGLCLLKGSLLLRKPH